MRRLYALFRKEVSEHFGVALAAGAFMALILGVLLLANYAAPRTMTVLDGHRSFVRIFLPIFGLALGHRLIVREYHGRTQRFIEALPIRRWEFVVMKYGIGEALLVGCALLSLAAFAAVAAFREPITVGWLGLILVRTVAFVSAVWSFLFVMGLMGRWRIPIYIVTFIVLLFLELETAVELSRFGPFALVGETMVLERDSLPVRALAETAGLSTALTAIGAALALLNEGSVAEAMAKSMTLREKTAVGLAIVFGIIALDFVDAKPEKPEFAFEAEQVVRLEEPTVTVLYLDDANRVEAEQIARVAQSDLQRLASELDIAELPPVHVALRPTASPYRTERVVLEDDDEAVLLRAPYTDPAFDRVRFRAAVVEEVLDRVSQGRADFEPYRWIQLGYAGWFVEREAGVSERTLRTALLTAREREPSARDLGRFERLEEALGPDASAAWATSAAFAVARATSDEALVALARDTVGRPPSWGLRAVYAARSDPPFERLEREHDLDEVAFEAAWAEELGRLGRDPRSAAIAEVPRVEASVEVETLEGSLRQVRWRVDSPRLDRLATCALLHTEVGPFDSPLDETTLTREELPCDEVGGDEGGLLVGRYGRGERAFFAIEVTDAAHELPVRVLANRVVIE